MTGADAGYEIIGGQLKAGDRLEVTYSGSQTDVGKIVNRIVKAVVYRGEEDVTSQYAIAPFQDGELEVTPATVTMSLQAQLRLTTAHHLQRQMEWLSRDCRW